MRGIDKRTKVIRFKARIDGYVETGNVSINAVDKSSDRFVTDRNRIAMRKIFAGFKNGDVVEIVIKKVENHGKES